MASEFTRLNGFSQASNGVFHGNDDEREFNYSDGAASEIMLRDILSAAKNLSSDSDELAQQISDWPSEYHLSPTRANLLRPLDLSSVERVLELGCGCGSITRYLGEATEAQIDAVEGSPIRADLAALRCRDQQNISISSANFNQVEFPENHYDLVLFVGVTEYAGRFSERETDQEALQDLLALARRALKPNGVVLIAIENRLGLKYIEGACEDHYGKPFIGIDNYPESAGIRTYSRDEWLSEITQSGFSASQFIYPFPDYKIPTLLVHDQAVTGLADAGAADAMSRVKSRDYVAPFDMGDKEAALWQGKLDQGSLGESANSFMILLSDDRDVLHTMADFKIAEYDNFIAAYLSPAQIQEQTGAQPAAPEITPNLGWLTRVRNFFRLG